MDWRWIVATLGVAAELYAAGGYVLAIFRGDAKPHRFTWFVFFVGAAGGAYFTYKGHAGWTGVSVATTGAILIGITWLLSLSPKYGHKGLERWYHPWLAADALLVYLMQVISSFPPLLAVMAAVIVDFTAVQLLWEKAWKEPETEPVVPYAVGTLGAALGLAALAQWNFTSATYPLYFVITNLVIVLILLWRKGQLASVSNLLKK